MLKEYNYYIFKILSLLLMNLKQSITAKLNEFLTLCGNHNVKYIYAFGSSVSNSFNELTSDFDFVVEIEAKDPIKRGKSLLILWDKFEELFHRRVDLLTESSIKNPILKNQIEKTKVLIYDGKSQTLNFEF